MVFNLIESPLLVINQKGILMSKYSTNIDSLIKELRKKKEITLKDLSSVSNLSVGFLSQLERGTTSLAIDSLEIIAHSLDVELEFFFDFNNKKRENYFITLSLAFINFLLQYKHLLLNSPSSSNCSEKSLFGTRFPHILQNSLRPSLCSKINSIFLAIFLKIS